MYPLIRSLFIDVEIFYAFNAFLLYYSKQEFRGAEHIHTLFLISLTEIAPILSRWSGPRTRTKNTHQPKNVCNIKKARASIVHLFVIWAVAYLPTAGRALDFQSNSRARLSVSDERLIQRNFAGAVTRKFEWQMLLNIYLSFSFYSWRRLLLWARVSPDAGQSLAALIENLILHSHDFAMYKRIFGFAGDFIFYECSCYQLIE